MSSFYKEFLLEKGKGKKFSFGPAREISIAAFGKHPAWKDFMVPIGLRTKSLMTAQQLLQEGIKNQFGAWDKLSSEKQVPAFGHLFLWRRSGQFLLGRLYASRDGANPSRAWHPLTVCVHGNGVPAHWALQQLLPQLEQIPAAGLIRTPEETNATVARVWGDEAFAKQLRQNVEQSITNLELRLRAQLAALPKQKISIPISPQERAQFANCAELGPERQAWRRIIHYIANNFFDYETRKSLAKSNTTFLRPRWIRLPACASNLPQALRQWSDFLSFVFPGDTPLFLAAPLEASWVDVILGEPSANEFFYLRATPKAAPVVSTIPYEMTPAIERWTDQLLSAYERGDKSAPRFDPDKLEAAPAPGRSSGSKLFFWLGATLLLALAGLGLFWNKLPLSRPAGNDSGSARSTSLTARAVNTAATGLLAQPTSETKALATGPVHSLTGKVTTIAPPANQAQGPLTLTSLVAATKLSSAVPAKVVITPLPTNPPPVLYPPFKSSIGMEMVWVAGLPGTPKGGWVGKYEVTQGQYDSIMDSNPSFFNAEIAPARGFRWTDRLPVEKVAWTQAEEFCAKLTAKDRQAGRVPAGWHYQLPTVRQWDYFLDGATFEDAVTSRAEERNVPQAVGQKAPNSFGLHDVLGNVWEWCRDEQNHLKLLKGGAFNIPATFHNRPMTERTLFYPEGPQARSDAGFRCLLVPAQSTTTQTLP